MKNNTLVKLSGMVLVAVLVSIAILSIVYLLQHPQLVYSVATVSWNG